MSALIVIPARYASQRYPGKPLAVLKGASGVEKSLIQRSWDAASAVSGASRVVVATDDDRIKEASEAFGADVIMTSPDCQNGTERCAEVAARIGDSFDVIVNFQGDAPLTPPWFVSDLIDAISADDSVGMATPVLRCDGKSLNGFLADRAAGRVGGTTAVFGTDHKALYFSKEVIPFAAETYADDAPTPVYHHVGVYAYKPAALESYLSLPQGPLETLEGLEQLRFLENNLPVLCVEVDARGREFWELNNPDDVPRLEAMMSAMGLE